MTPHWEAQKASWGEEAYLFERLASPAMWLCRLLAAMEKEDAQSVPEPISRLLVSSVATVLKAARVTDIDADFLLRHIFVSSPLLWQGSSNMLHATICMLIPRLAGGSSQQGASSAPLSAARDLDAALGLSLFKDPDLSPLMVLGSCHMTTLVNISVADLLHCSESSAITRAGAHFALGRMSQYAASLSAHIAFISTQGCAGAPSGTAQLRDLLARPLLQLLHSPLLDTLVALQHVMVDVAGSTRSLEVSKWEASMGPADAKDSGVAMQVVCTNSGMLLWSTQLVALAII